MSTTARRRRCSRVPRAPRKEDSTAEAIATRQRDRAGGDGWGERVVLFAQGWSMAAGSWRAMGRTPAPRNHLPIIIGVLERAKVTKMTIQGGPHRGHSVSATPTETPAG